MIDCEDGLINFMLYKLSESFSFTKKIGYYYIVTKQSITHDSTDFKIRLRSNFLYFKYLSYNNHACNKAIQKTFSKIKSKNLFYKYFLEYNFWS